MSCSLGFLKENFKGDNSPAIAMVSFGKLSKLFDDGTEAEEDDFDVDSELSKPVFSRAGDIWTLGRHRLVCGDSTKAETYEILMQGKKANLVITDPPSGVGGQGTGSGMTAAEIGRAHV